eukprot:1109807-Pelagomonas_calceolata.AAC.1
MSPAFPPRWLGVPSRAYKGLQCWHTKHSLSSSQQVALRAHHRTHLQAWGCSWRVKAKRG